MENNTTKVEMIKPVFLKAGIPIAITLAGYIIAKITTRKISIFQISPIQKCTTLEGSDTQPMTFLKSLSNIAHEVSRNEDDHQNHENSKSLSCIEANDNDHCSTCALYRDLQEKCKIKEDIEAKFQQYTHLKEKEIALMDMQHKLLLEVNKVDFFSKEITLMEAENQRFQSMVIEYLRFMELLDLSKSKNSLLHRRVKKLLKKIKESSRVMKEQNFQLEAKEKEISRNQEGLEMKDHAIKKMELEIQQLQMAIEQLQMEKAETSNQSKSDVEVVTIEDYKELVNELEQLQKDKASEDTELIYLRHELMRRKQEQMEQRKNQELNLGEEDRETVEEFVPKVHEVIMRRSSSVGHNEPYLCSPINGGHSNDHSKRRKLIQKFKKWLEGSDKAKHETNCFKRHSVSDHTGEDLMFPSRKSCSSA